MVALYIHIIDLSQFYSQMVVMFHIFPDFKIISDIQALDYY